MATIEKLVFEMPILAPAVIAGLGLVIAFVLASRAATKKALVVVAAAVVLAGGLAVSSRLVETDREVVTRRSIELTRILERGDSDAARAYLSERLVLAANGRTVTGGGLASVLNGVEIVPRFAESLTPNVRDQRVVELGDIVLTLGVRAELTFGGLAPATAELTWRDEGDAWRIVRIDLLRLGAREPSPESLRQNL